MTVIHYKFLIIGGGMTAAAATRGIREVDANSPIGLIGTEDDRPYNRPPLTKGLWKGEDFESIWSELGNSPPTLHVGCTVAAIDVANKQVTDTRGTIYAFEKLLLATGGTPRRLPFGDDHIIYYRTVADYRGLRALSDKHRRFAVIGGGFIGSEIAAALRMNGKEVVILLPEEVIGNRVFPRDLGRFVTDFYREKGVEVRTGDTAVGLESRGEQLVLKTKSGQEVSADAVVAGIGIQPNIALAQDAGLTVGNGIQVDQFLRTSHPDIYAAGDVAEFPDLTLGGRRRVEHEDNANAMGRLAGRAMAGEQDPYTHIPLFYSDLFELGYEAVGDLDSRLDTVADWTDPFHEGVIYYLRSGKVRGALMWNVWDQVDAARELLAESRTYQPADLKGRLPR
jgi:3-phenylpropionate/trans-cinnamate dioxygenase ferredoxin reductase subunit